MKRDLCIIGALVLGGAIVFAMPLQWFGDSRTPSTTTTGPARPAAPVQPAPKPPVSSPSPATIAPAATLEDRDAERRIAAMTMREAQGELQRVAKERRYRAYSDDRQQKLKREMDLLLKRIMELKNAEPRSTR